MRLENGGEFQSLADEMGFQDKENEEMESVDCSVLLGIANKSHYGFIGMMIALSGHSNIEDSFKEESMEVGFPHNEPQDTKEIDEDDKSKSNLEYLENLGRKGTKELCSNEPLRASWRLLLLSHYWDL